MVCRDQERSSEDVLWKFGVRCVKTLQTSTTKIFLRWRRRHVCSATRVENREASSFAVKQTSVLRFHVWVKDDKEFSQAKLSMLTQFSSTWAPPPGGIGSLSPFQQRISTSSCSLNWFKYTCTTVKISTFSLFFITTSSPLYTSYFPRPSIRQEVFLRRESTHSSPRTSQAE